MIISRLIIIDGNAPWVRSLFLAMPPEIQVRFLRAGQPGVFRRLSDKPWPIARRWRSCGPNASERWIIIPGWNKAPAVSTWLTTRAASAAAGNEPGAAVVFTLPQYAGVAEKLTIHPSVYYAHDPFEHYAWDKDRTRELEDRMLHAADMTFAISRRLRDDLAARTTHTVIYSPNAVSADFITAMDCAHIQRPADLAEIPRPVVGCTGQINETYDWAMLSELAALMPDVSFVFIGGITAEDWQVRQLIDSVLKGRPNIHWLGPKPHDDLPGYLRAFDVCLNPLAPGPHADRRSPLRLYDFLATGKPVVSTAIEEASCHEQMVWIAADAAEMERVIRQALSSERKVNREQRMEYIQRNTWQARAAQVLREIQASQ